jgi:hypothetical protein
MYLMNLSLTHNLLFCFLALLINGTWQPGIGDPSVMGWVTVIAYSIAAFLCFRCAWYIRRLLPSRRFKYHYWLWLGLGISLVILGINKQLDLQSWLTIFGKKLAIAQGWYLWKRFVQVAFILGIVIVLVTLFIRIRKIIGKDWKLFRLTFLGFFFLSGFILIRAASFHHIDHLIGFDLAGIRVNWLLEISGLICISFSCFDYRRSLQKLQCVKES